MIPPGRIRLLCVGDCVLFFHLHKCVIDAACIMRVRATVYLMSLIALVSAHRPCVAVGGGLEDFHLNKTEVYRFENGLTLLVREDHSAPVVSVQAWVGTGSIHEGRWLGAGISHFVEHMLFKGTERRGVGEIAREAHELGGRMNAYTSLDRTVYFIDLPSGGWRQALDIWVDAIFHSNFPEEEFLKEQEVIRREFAMGKDDPGRQATLLLLETAFCVHPYRYPTIGYLDLFNNLTRRDLVDYHRARYVPENVTFVVVGDVKKSEVREEFARLTSAIPRNFLQQVCVPEEPEQLAPRRVNESFKTDLLHLRMGWHVPGLEHPDAVALDALAVVLGQGMSSRLHRAVVEEAQLAHSISSFCFTPRGSGIFAIAATADRDKKQRLEDEIQRVVNAVLEGGVSSEELEKARRQVLSTFLSGLETMSGQAFDIGSSWMLTQDPDYSATYVQRVQNLSREDLCRVARLYLVPQRLNLVTLQSDELVAEQMKQEPPSPAVGDAGREKIFTKTLDNGVRLLIFRDARLPMANLQVAWLGGVLFETPETSGIARLTGSTLLKGTATRSAEQISREIENLGGRIDVETGQNSSILTLQFLSADLPAAIGLAEDVLLRPAFSEKEVERERQLQIASLRQEREQPMSVCGDLLRARLYGSGHPYSRNPLGSEPSLMSLTGDMLRNFHNTTLLGANTVVALFGDVDVEKSLELLSKAFSKITAGTLNVPTASIPENQVRVEVSEKLPRQQAVIQIGFPGLSLGDPLRPAAEVLVQALSDMSSRLFVRIREKQGLAYYVGAAQRMGPLPGHVVLYAGCAEDKVRHVIDELLEEARMLADNGLSEEEISRAKVKLVGDIVMQRQSQSAMARAAALNELFGLGAASVFTQEEEVEAVTTEKVLEASRRIFGKAPVVASVLPIEQTADEAATQAAVGVKISTTEPCR